MKRTGYLVHFLGLISLVAVAFAAYSQPPQSVTDERSSTDADVQELKAWLRHLRHRHGGRFPGLSGLLDRGCRVAAAERPSAQGHRSLHGAQPAAVRVLQLGRDHVRGRSESDGRLRVCASQLHLPGNAQAQHGRGTSEGRRQRRFLVPTPTRWIVGVDPLCVEQQSSSTAV